MSSTALSILEMQKNAALEEIRQQREQFRRVEALVIPNPRNGERVTEVIALGGDYLVEITHKTGKTLWTCVIGGKPSNVRHHTWETAVLYMLASRGNSENTSMDAAYYAARVLNLPTDDD